MNFILSYLKYRRSICPGLTWSCIQHEKDKQGDAQALNSQKDVCCEVFSGKSRDMDRKCIASIDVEA